MRANTCWAFTGNVAYAACQWVVFVLLVKALEPIEVGHFAFAIAVTGPTFVLANARLRTLLVTGVATNNGFSDYFRTRLLTTGAAIGVSIAIAGFVGSAGLVGVVTIVAAAKGCDATSDICHGLFQRDLDMRTAATGLITNGVCSVAFVAASLAYRPSLAAATVAYGIGSLAALTLWDLPRARRRAPLSPARADGFTLAAAARLLKRAAPLGLSSAIGSLQVNVPRYFVTVHLGPAALAVFAALSYLPLVGHFVVNAVSQTALPVLSRDLHESRERFRARVAGLVLAGIGVGVICLSAAAVFGRAALSFLYSPEYAQHNRVLLWLLVATTVTFASVFLGTATVARQRFVSQFVISFASLIVVALTIAPLVNRFGLAGAAWSLLAGAVVELCAYLVITVRDLRSSAPRSCPVPDPLVGGAHP
jgi:O-antigen/teichoic acid export membrane protein